MAVSDYLGLQIMEVGAFANTWGDVANIDLIRLEAASRGYKKITLSGAQTLDATDILTDAQVGLGDEESFFHFIELAGTAGTVSVQVKDLYWIVYNNTDGNLTFQPTGETGITLTQGKVHHFYYDLATTSFVDVTALQIPNTFSATTLITGPSGTWDSGGMDLAASDTYAIAGTDVLSATTLGTGVLASSLTSLGTIASLVATTADINGGTFDGVVGGTTPAAGSFTTLTVTGDITTDVDGTNSIGSTAVRWLKGWFDSLTVTGDVGAATGTFTGEVTGLGFTGTLDGVLGGGTPAAVTGTTITANTSFSGPGTGLTGTAASLTAGNVTTNANLTGAITSSGSNATSLGSFTTAELLAAVTGETGTGAVVFATSPTLVTPALGTPASGVLDNCTGTAAGLTAGTATVATAANGLKSATTTVSISGSAAPSTGQTLVAVNSTTATWQTPAGSGNVSNTGTPLNNQLAVWTDATTVEGDANLTWDGSTLTVTGPVIGTTVEATADTSAGDNAAMGYTATEGLILTGQGSTNDVTIKNDVDTTVAQVPTGTTTLACNGLVSAQSFSGIALTLTGDLTLDSLVQPTIKIMDIGDWDMDTDATISVAHSLTAGTIRSVSVAIRQDTTAGSPVYMLGAYSPAGTTNEYVEWNDTVVIMARSTGGIFDNTSFNATGYNRGWITITYV
jgi:hypothetical protein